MIKRLKTKILRGKRLRTKMRLEDTFNRTGKDLYGFRLALKELDKFTNFQLIDFNNIQLLTLNSRRTDDEAVFFYANDSSDPREVGMVGWPVKIKRERMNEKKVSDGLLQELINSSKLMLNIDNKVYFTSREFAPKLASRVGISGQRIGIPTPKRDEYMVEALSTTIDKGTLMYRQVGEVKKAFTVHSKKYVSIPQSTLLDIISELETTMGKSECVNWYVDHSISYVYLQFPERAADVAATYGLPDEIIPGVYLATSDTGDCSITANTVWSIKKGTVRDSSFKKRHIGEFDLSELMEDVKQNVFEKYTILPEKLAELLLIDIDEPKEVLAYIFKEAKIRKSIGVKQANELLQYLKDEINPSENYTAYSIVMTIMDLPSRVSGLNHYMEILLQNAVYNAVFLDYSKFTTKTRLYLTA